MSDLYYVAYHFLLLRNAKVIRDGAYLWWKWVDPKVGVMVTRINVKDDLSKLLVANWIGEL